MATLLQLLTEKNVFFPRITIGSIVIDSLYDNDCVERIMEQHFKIIRKFREVEFRKCLRRARDTALKGYEDEILIERDLVYY